MNIDKNNIIIKEIHHWKNNKLLPETYCDFLLALYTEGNVIEDEINSKKHQTNNRIISFQGLLIGLLLLLLSVSLLVLYFTELSFVLQMTIVGFLFMITIVIAVYFIKKRAFYKIPLSISLIQFLLLSIFLVEYITNGSQIWIGGVVVVNCLLWILIGTMYRVFYLIISGVIGLTIFVLTTLFY